jgi:tRNA (cytidine32/uridine32-2'-O)-methyltransferase
MSTKSLAAKKSEADILNSIVIVMLETSHPGNIGSAARVMKNMGLTQLRLVSPEKFPDPQAQWLASGAQDVLENAQIFSSLSEAVADCSWVMAASARNRSIPWPQVNAKEAAQEVARLACYQPVAIVFGREASGLTNEELQACQTHLLIPTHDIYPVLNVAMAIGIVCYELRQALLQGFGESDWHQDQMPIHWCRWDDHLATHQQRQLFDAHLLSVLERLKFIDPENPKQLPARIRRLLARIRLDHNEVNLMRGALKQIEKALDDAV